ncbi:phage holin family protein [Candidatus Peregrinibacteria bacterium]|nr:phage holin family protein [Candidatus Peregrinibacteria bacterium]
MGIIKRFIFGIIANGIALYVVIRLLENVDYRGDWKFFLIAGLAIGVLNTIIKPLLKLMSLPFLLVTAGLFLIVINAFILWLTKEFINTLNIAGTELIISGWKNYLIGGIIFGVVNWFLHFLIKK